MPTVFLPALNLAVHLPYRHYAGEVLDSESGEFLAQIWTKRLIQRVRWGVSRGEITPANAQEMAEKLALAPMAPYSVFDEDDMDDPIIAEAMAMAEALINSRMASEGLPAPKNISEHAKALIQAMPSLVEKARTRVEARFQAAASTLDMS